MSFTTYHVLFIFKIQIITLQKIITTAFVRVATTPINAGIHSQKIQIKNQKSRVIQKSKI